MENEYMVGLPQIKMMVGTPTNQNNYMVGIPTNRAEFEPSFGVFKLGSSKIYQARALSRAQNIVQARLVTRLASSRVCSRAFCTRLNKDSNKFIDETC